MSALRPTPSEKHLPAVDAHVVAEDSRAEIVDGKLLLTPPAREPHGTKHLDLAHLLAAHVAKGFRAALATVAQGDSSNAIAYPFERYPCG